MAPFQKSHVEDEMGGMGENGSQDAEMANVDDCLELSMPDAVEYDSQGPGPATVSARAKHARDSPGDINTGPQSRDSNEIFASQDYEELFVPGNTPDSYASLVQSLTDSFANND